MAKAFSFDYHQVDAVVSSFVPEWRAAGFDAVVAIARGGLAPGLMVSTALDVPLYGLHYQRSRRKVDWFTQDQPDRQGKILLVEDIAGRGTTLSDCMAFLKDHGYQFQVFTLAWDDESRVIPDYGLKMPAGARAWFPWEREAITTAFGQTGNMPDRREFEYASWAIDLDGILLPDIPEADYLQNLQQALSQRDGLLPYDNLPAVDVRSVPIITGRPEDDRARTQRWLDRHGFAGPLIMRDPQRHTAAQTAEHKAQAIAAGYHTHFIESDAMQALEIAALLKVARVVWWNGHRAVAVHASQVDDLKRL